MAVGLAARFDAAADLTFHKRVAEAVAEAAIAIYSEAATAKTPLRIAYATAVLNDPPLSLMFNGAPIQSSKRSLAFVLALVAQGVDGTDTTAAGDTAIRNAVAAVWNALAGA